jgi:hypothetical protein
MARMCLDHAFPPIRGRSVADFAIIVDAWPRLRQRRVDAVKSAKTCHPIENRERALFRVADDSDIAENDAPSFYRSPMATIHHFRYITLC